MPDHTVNSFSVLMKLTSYLAECLKHFTFPPVTYEWSSSFAAISIITFLLSSLWVYSDIVALICILLMANDVEHLFICLFAMYVSFLVECIFKIFAIFLTELSVDFRECFVNSTYYFFKHMVCKYCLPALSFLFHPLHVTFRGVKFKNFDEVSFIT